MDARIINSFYIYFAEELGITQFLSYYPEFYKGYSALITCIDSNRNVMFSEESFKRDKVRYEVIGQALLVQESSLANMVKRGTYFPFFSEIYFFKGKVPLFRPENRFTSDGLYFDEDVPDLFFETMDKVQADRYLSDGCGLNIASRTPLDVKKIEEIEAQQKH